MHHPPFDNRNAAIVGIDDPVTPLCYFNRVVLRAGETFASTVPGYETCLVPATGWLLWRLTRRPSPKSPNHQITKSQDHPTP